MKNTMAFGLFCAALLIAANAAQALDLLDSEAAFFRDSDCSSEYIKLGKGDFPDFTKLDGNDNKEGWNDKVSCILLGSNAKVSVYDHTNFRGASKNLQWTEKNRGKISFEGSNWNRRISSAKILNGPGPAPRK